MAKCTRCGKKGLFLRLTDGLCDNCRSTILMEEEQAAIQKQIDTLKAELSDQEATYAKIESAAMASALEKSKAEESLISERIQKLTVLFNESEEKLRASRLETEKQEKSAASAVRKLQKSREYVRAIQNACDMFDTEERVADIDQLSQNVDDFLEPTISLNLQCLDIKELRKRFRQNEKNIQDTFQKYKGRYTTKANITIYRLMVIALSAELQNVLHSIGYNKLDDSLKSIQDITNKYYAIATDGNQSIAPTLKKFIGEIDYFFQEAVRIEYEYYVQKERAREEQRAIREQMRQEAEERRELERQQKQIEKEENKFRDQISQLSSQLEQSSDDEKNRLLEERIAELTRQLSSVAEQKEKIIKLQNGKAGNVYVISNIGSFGDGVFKIGMTRRAEPMDRVNELGNASVPFPFDVHCMIFSDDAVDLETKLHHTLNDQRVNKVNLRKEFFRVDLDQLESLVSEIAPTASFKRTALAEQYRQSLSISHVSENPEPSDDLDDED